MRDEHYIKSGNTEIAVKERFKDDDGWSMFDVDVISHYSVTVEEFIDIFMNKIRKSSVGRIAFIDGSETDTETALCGTTICTWFGDEVSEYEHKILLDEPIRFASLTRMLSDDQSVTNELLMLFVSSKEA